MTLFLPLLYLLAGYSLGKTRWPLKKFASALLTRAVIPLVIIFNIATHFRSMAGIIVATAAVMMILLVLARLFSRDPVKNLCFFYLNIGWLGLPVASTLSGNGAAVIVIAAYVGSSIVGNALGAGMLAGQLKPAKLLLSPPVLALVAGILLIPFSDQVTRWGSELYLVAKFLMSLLGMTILGIWLSAVSLSREDFRAELCTFLLRAAVLAVLTGGLLLLAIAMDQTLITSNATTLWLFCLLPPAANIIVLETHYLGSGRSARPISCGTCISMAAIALYAAGVLLLQ